MNGPPDGIFLVDKEAGETSFDVVRKLRRVLGGRKRCKVGHAGTLDPFATGLLVLLLGQGTKLAPFLMAGVKEYRATLRLGAETDTLDCDGRVVGTAPVPPLGLPRVEDAARGFVGHIEQVPPAFSALKDRGQRAYQRARRGESPRLRPRPVTIHQLEIESFRAPELTFRLSCSAGTYVRSLAAELARRLGTVGHLVALRRLGSGPWRVERATPSGVIRGPEGAAILVGGLIPLAAALPELTVAEVPAALAARIRQGYRPHRSELPASESETGRHLRVLHQGRLVAVLEARQEGRNDDDRFRVERVFADTERPATGRPHPGKPARGPDTGGTA